MKIAVVSHPTMDVLFPESSVEIWTQEVACRLSQRADLVVFGTGKHGFSPQCFTQGRLTVLLLPTALEHAWLTFLDHTYRRIAKRLPGLLKLWYALGGQRWLAPFDPASVWYYLSYIWQVALAIRRQDIDVVHIHSFSQYARVIRWFNPQVSIVVHAHNNWWLTLEPQVIEQQLQASDRLLTCSEYTTQLHRAGFSRLRHRFMTVYNGVNLERFCSSIVAETTGGCHLLYVGRISPEKGLHILLAALQQVAQSYPEVHLEIVGGADYSSLHDLSQEEQALVSSFYDPQTYLCHYWEDIQQQITDLNLGDRVSFTPFLPHNQLVQRYHQTDIFVLPAVWHEPFGMVVVEAMAAGLPVIATRSGGIPEIIDHRQHGLLVPRAEVEELAQAIHQLLADPSLRQRLAAAGQQRVQQLFSWDRVSETLFSLYQSLDTDYETLAPQASAKATL